MGIFNDLDRLIERDIEDIEDESGDEDRPTIRKIASKVMGDEEESDKAAGGAVSDILKHIDAVKRAAEFIDKLTTDQANTTAFEAEISLRKALSKMEDLSKEAYKSREKADKEI